VKVYGVEAGDYSDYHIVGLWTELAHAEKAVEIHNAGIEGDYGRASLITMELRGTAPGMGLRITSYFSNGVESEPGPNSSALVEYVVPEYELRRPTSVGVYLDTHTHPIDLAKGRPPSYGLRVEGLDAERVRKVFSERRTILKAAPWMTMSEYALREALLLLGDDA
jgi:hypothetical protein